MILGFDNLKEIKRLMNKHSGIHYRKYGTSLVMGNLGENRQL